MFACPTIRTAEEFFVEYWAVRSGKRTRTIKTTWNALIIEYYKSPEFTKKAKGHARKLPPTLRGNPGEERQQGRHEVPAQGRDRRAGCACRQLVEGQRAPVGPVDLCRKAVDLEWIERNPVFDIRKLKGGEYEAWPDEKLDAFERYCDEHGLTTARTIFELCVGTGQRFGDCLKMTWDDFDGEFMDVCQEKTGTKIRVYCPERLQTYLGGLPKTGRHISPPATSRGRSGNGRLRRPSRPCGWRWG